MHRHDGFNSFRFNENESVFVTEKEFLPTISRKLTCDFLPCMEASFIPACLEECTRYARKASPFQAPVLKFTVSWGGKEN